MLNDVIFLQDPQYDYIDDFDHDFDHDCDHDGDLGVYRQAYSVQFSGAG